MLGILAFHAGRQEEAVERIRKAISLRPDLAAYRNNLGAVLQKLGRLEEAVSEYRQALAVAPDFAELLSNLGGLLRECARPHEALPYLERAVKLNPSHVGAQRNLGLVLHALGRGEEGLRHTLKAIEMAPQSVDAVRQAACMLADLKRWEEGAVYSERWAALEPENHAAYLGSGDSYEKRGLWREAARQYWKALELKPDCAEAANNLGTCLSAGGHQADALAAYQKAVELKPDYPDAWVNLGIIMKTQARLETAMRCMDRAVSLGPASPEALWNRSLCALAMGRLAEGWADYDRRWKAVRGAAERPFPQPRWDGSDPAGKTILVWMEQGLGDQILFASMLPDLIAAGARCILECEPRLRSLFARSFPTVEAVKASEPAHPSTQSSDIDFQIPAGSLARWFRPTLESFPQHHGFLVPDPALVSDFRGRVAALGNGLKVGICWRSMMNTGIRSNDYSRLTQWGPILSTSGVQFVNLQYDQCAEELREAQRLFGTPVQVWDDVDLKDDQESVAALISTLDLVLSACTAVDQMAGGLGVTAWVMSRTANDLWALGTDHCPWYPGIRLFACDASQPWEPVIERVAAELGQLAAHRGHKSR
jgi:Flp pilus assembly protein TadD